MWRKEESLCGKTIRKIKFQEMSRYPLRVGLDKVYMPARIHNTTFALWYKKRKYCGIPQIISFVCVKNVKPAEERYTIEHSKEDTV